MNQYQRYQKLRNLLAIAWTINALLFIISHFTYAWAVHAESWSEQAWQAMIWATSVTKVLLSGACIATIVVLSNTKD